MGIGTNVLLVGGGAVLALVIQKLRAGESIGQIIGGIPFIGGNGGPIIVDVPIIEGEPVIDPVTGEEIPPTIILT